MIRHTLASVAVVFLVVVGLSLAPPAFAAQTTIFSQNFDGMTLGTNIWEPSGGGTQRTAGETSSTLSPTRRRAAGRTTRARSPDWMTRPKAFPSGKAGASPRRTGGPASPGIRGARSSSCGQGTVAVADPDEWDDLGDPESLGTYNAFLTTPSFSMVGAAAMSGTLTFDSSFRPEGNQTGMVEIAYDGGDWAEESLGSTLPTTGTRHSRWIFGTLGAVTSAALRFSMINAVNNYWWAIDNIELTTSAGLAFSENFESVTLGPAAWEPSGCGRNRRAPRELLHPTPPDGWSVDNSRMPTGGVPEWRGWTFVSPELWIAADDQGHSEFTKGQTVIAVADSDEFDDLPSSDGNYDTSLDTPAISLATSRRTACPSPSIRPGRAEGSQTVTVTVSYDGGTPSEILRWESDSASPNYP